MSKIEAITYNRVKVNLEICGEWPCRWYKPMQLYHIETLKPQFVEDDDNSGRIEKIKKEE